MSFASSSSSSSTSISIPGAGVGAGTDHQPEEDALVLIAASSLTKVESLTPEPESVSSAPSLELHLSLLQPLAHPRMLAACRNPSSKITYVSGERTRTPKSETLDLTALDKAWRRIVSEMTPASAIVFDLSLPEKPDEAKNLKQEAINSISAELKGVSLAEGKVDDLDEARSKPKPKGEENDFLQAIYWSSSAPPPPHCISPIVIDLRNVMRTAVTIASTTRMRKRREPVRFNVVFNEKDGISTGGIQILRKQLEGIEQSALYGGGHGGKAETAAVSGHVVEPVAPTGGVASMSM